jgi:hypothetical membrane protein
MSTSLFSLLSIVGASIVILTILYSVLVYRGNLGERYSLLNHFISELGELGVSKGARVFNLGLILGGLCLLPSVVWLGFLFQSFLGWLGMASGIIASLGVAAVGLFPMNELKSHGRASITFFRGGLAMVFLFGMAILFQPADRLAVPKSFNIVSLLAFLAYGSFLTLLTIRSRRHPPADALNLQEIPERRRVWLLPMLEWVVFFATIAWLFGVAFLI